jgi:hypothetical protein
VPANATAVMLNVTAVAPGDAGFLTVFPCGSTRPLASTVNYVSGQVVPNAVLARIGSDGSVCVFTLADADVLVDVSGYVAAGAGPSPLVPARLLDSRAGGQTVDGAFAGVGRQAAGATLQLGVRGRAGVPEQATAVMLNVTAVAPGGAGFLTVFACGQSRPLASSVNYSTGQIVPNAVFAPLSADGKVCVYTLADADILVDVSAYA